MKKILLTFFTLCLTAAAAMAQTSYTEDLVVSVNGVSTEPAPATVTVQTADDGQTCTFALKNFLLTDGESTIPVGNISLSGVAMEQNDGYTAISTTQSIVIEPGDMEGLGESDWLGPMLGEVPIDLKGQLTDDHLYVTIDIDMTATLGQVINVVLGSPITPDEPSGISSATVQRAAATLPGVYNLSGIRVADKLTNALPKGVYIVNGQKIIK